MVKWQPLDRSKSKEMHRKLRQENAFESKAGLPVEVYYLGSAEFRDKRKESTTILNRKTHEAFQKFCPKDSIIYVLEPWHQSFQFALNDGPFEWEYDVCGGDADSVYFVTSNARQGTYYSFDDSTLTIFGHDMLRVFDKKGCALLKYMISRDGKKLLRSDQVPHMARHKHLFL